MKKIILGLLSTIAILCMIFIFLMGGQIGAYAWNLAVFVFAPFAVLGLIIQLIILMISLFRRKNILWNILFIAISIVFTLPITVLFGISPITYPTKASPSDGIVLMMPLEEGVLFGGKEYKTHAMWPSECYAYDILKEPYNLGSDVLTDYGIWGADIVAPVSGTVIAIENNEPDITPNIEEFTSSLGNYIFIEIDGKGTYLILAHLQKNSILVDVDEHIEVGQLLGKVGNSGTTSEPHLHIQHQKNNPMTTVFPTCAQGLPIEFR